MTTFEKKPSMLSLPPHNDVYVEDITIANCGPVSSGKSTLTNGICGHLCSKPGKKKTTMMPQWYKIVTEDADTVDQIYKKNQEVNDEISKLRAEGKFSIDKFKEVVHKIYKIQDYIDLPDEKAIYYMLDMPGLNCGNSNDMYYNYLTSHSSKIDIFVGIFDITYGLNTDDEVKILKTIAEEIRKNNHGYVHFLLNKCDSVTYNEATETLEITNAEDQDIYKTCVDVINANCEQIKGRFSVSPISAQRLYDFRSVKMNTQNADIKQIDSVIKYEEGYPKLSVFKNDDEKRKYVEKLLTDKPSVYVNWMKNTGYYTFQKHLNDIINQNYSTIVSHYIDVALTEMCSKQITDFDATTTELAEINKRIQRLETLDSKYKIAENIRSKIEAITQRLNDYVENGITSYSGSTVEQADGFIKKLKKFGNTFKNIFSTKGNPIEESKKKVEKKRIELLNKRLSEYFNKDIFTELYTNNTLEIDKFAASIDNTLNKKSDMPLQYDVISLLREVHTITVNVTSNNKWGTKYLINMIIEHTVCKSPIPIHDSEKLTKFIKLCSQLTDSNIDIVWNILKSSIDKSIDKWVMIYRYWIELHSSIIVTKCTKIKNIYTRFAMYADVLLDVKKTLNLESVSAPYLSLIEGQHENMDKLFDALCECFQTHVKPIVPKTVPLFSSKSTSQLNKSDNVANSQSKLRSSSSVRSLKTYAIEDDFRLVKNIQDIDTSSDSSDDEERQKTTTPVSLKEIVN